MPFRRLPILLALLFLATGIPTTAEFYTDWLWYQEVGYQQVFVRSLSARATIGLIIGGIVLLFLGSTCVWRCAAFAAASSQSRPPTVRASSASIPGASDPSCSLAP